MDDLKLRCKENGQQSTVIAGSHVGRQWTKLSIAFMKQAASITDHDLEGRRKRPDTFSMFLESNVSFILCVLFVKQKLHGSKLIFLVEMLLPYVYLP